MELSKRRNAPHITHTENNKAALLSVSFFFFSCDKSSLYHQITRRRREEGAGFVQNKLELFKGINLSKIINFWTFLLLLFFHIFLQLCILSQRKGDDAAVRRIYCTNQIAIYLKSCSFVCYLLPLLLLLLLLNVIHQNEEEKKEICGNCCAVCLTIYTLSETG